MPTQDLPTASITSNAASKTVPGRYNRPAPSFTVYYDNVVVDTQ